MKYLFVIVVLVGGQIVSAQSDTAAVLTQAEAAYLSHDYSTALSLYEALFRGGVRDPGLYVNLGNSYYQVGDLGHALLNYRRAQQFWPRDADVSDNLARIRSERVDLQGDETSLLKGLAAFTSGVMAVWELSIFVGALWVIWFGLLSVFILNTNRRDALRILLLAVGIILMIGLLFLGSRLYLDSQRPSGVVISQVVQVKSGPGEAYLDLYSLHTASELHIWETRDGWVQFALPDGRLGWLPAQTVEIVQQ